MARLSIPLPTDHTRADNIAATNRWLELPPKTRARLWMRHYALQFRRYQRPDDLQHAILCRHYADKYKNG